jgi:hypothetical protein
VSVVDGAWLQELFPANFKTVDAGQRPAR